MVIDRTHCQVGDWSDPQRIKMLPAGVVLRSSTLVLAEDQAFTLIANDLYWYLDEPLTESALRLFRSDGLIRRASDPDAFHLAPKAVPARDGGLHVVSGESEQNAYPAPRHRFPLLPVDQLWYAYVSPNGSWGPSRLLLRAPHVLDWFSHSRPIVIDTEDVLHLVVASRRAQPGTIHYLRWSSDSSDIYQYDLSISPVALHSTIAVGPSGEIALAFVGAAPGQIRPRSNQLFVAEYDLQADKWYEPKPISDPANGYVSRPRLLGGDDSLDLIWLQGNVPGGKNDELRHIPLRSPLSGDLPNPKVSTVSVGEAVEDFSVVRDGCGRLHVVWVGNLSKPRLRSVVLKADGWSISSDPFPQLNVTALATAKDRRGVPTLTFFARDTIISATTREPFYGLYRSRYAP